MRLAIIVLVGLAACTSAIPTSTGTECASPDPMQYGYSSYRTPGCTGSDGDCNFGSTFMNQYCINCHDSHLKLDQRNGAPLFHDFDSLFGVMEVPDHIDQQTGWGPKAHNDFMPGAGTSGKCPSTLGGPLDEDCPEPTDEERTTLSMWVACERNRQHQFVDAGPGAPFDSPP